MDAIADQVERPKPPALPSPTADDLERWRQSPEHRRRAYLGFGAGVGFGLVLTAGELAFQGWRILPQQMTINLIWWPCLGLLVGSINGRPRLPGSWGWMWLRPPRVGTRTLMMVVAYVALLCGLHAATSRLGLLANQYYQKYYNSVSLAKPYREVGRKAGVDAAKARANVEGLRAGKIPEGLQPGQRDFLRSLEVDPKVTPDYRKYRRGLIQEGEERLATIHGRNEVIFGGLADYHDQLAVKYDHAVWHPWLPVEPDPPSPPTQ